MAIWYRTALLLETAAMLGLAQEPAIPLPEETRGRWEGEIVAVESRGTAAGWAPPRFQLRAGKELLWLNPAEMVHLAPGTRVAAEGIRYGGEIAASVIRTSAPVTCPARGDLKAAVILYEMPAAPMANSVPLADLRDVFFSTAGRSLAGHWQESSGGAARLTGDVWGPFVLRQDFVSTDTAGLLPELVRIAGSRVDWARYNQLYFLMSLTGAAGSTSVYYGGCQSVPGELSSRGYSGTISILGMIGRWSTERLLAKVTEQSYGSLGLGSADAIDAAPHVVGPPGGAGSQVFRGDPFSPLGGAAGHLAAPSKGILDWLTVGQDLREVETSGSFSLIPVEDQRAGAKALRVRRVPRGDQWLWLEYRQPRGYDQDLLAVTSHVFSGVLAHYEDPGEPLYQGRSLLLDFNPPATQYHYRDFRDAALDSNKSWSDPFGPLTLRASQASATGVTLNVTYDTPCATLSAAAASHGPGAETGSVTVTAPATCQWQAATIADWISVTAGGSGSGNGVVTYRLKPNATRSERRAGLFIARQEFRITQQTSAVDSPPTAAAFTPETGTGLSHSLQLTVTDPNGAADIDIVQVAFLGPSNRTCLVMLRPSYRLVYLLTEHGAWLEPRPMGTNANLQQSLCGLDVSKVTATASGNDLRFALPIVFSPHLGARVTAKIWVIDTSGRRVEFTSGAWSVPQGPACEVALSSELLEAPASGVSGRIDLQTGSGCPWLAGSAVTWLSPTSEPRGAGPATLTYAVNPNRSPGPRFGALVVGGRTLLVRQAGTGGTGPVVAENGVFNGASLQYGSPLSTGAWVTIQGENLASTRRTWRDSDFVDGLLPVALDGTSVLINGRPAFVYYISPTQLNVLAPEDTAVDKVRVEVTAPQGKADPVEANRAPLAPALFLFDAGNRRYPAAVHVDGAFVGRADLYPGANVRPARPGDTILLYGTGFGNTSPPTVPGEPVPAPARLSQTPVVYLGEKQATTVYAGLIAPGLYQLNVTVPDLPPGDHVLTVQASPSFLTQVHVYLTVE